ncbi:MAG: lipid A deacylase LpxR family protein [Rhizobium sp.]|nr:lipid A deacylase LpxR family protein [Rhizobium sp.]
MDSLGIGEAAGGHGWGITRHCVASVLFGAALCVGGPAWAQDGAVTLSIENDVFTGSDDSYSNGFGASWVSRDITSYGQSSFIRRWARFWDILPYVGDEGYTTYAAWSVVQEMHTPADIGLEVPLASDQPYAGVLYVNSTLYARSDRWSHAWELKLGVVGPSAQADTVQRQFHQLIGADEPMGWDAQLPDEPVANVGLTSTYLWKEGGLGRSAQWRLLPVGSVSLGNYFTGVGAGMYGELGWNLVDAFGGSSLREGLSAASTVGVGPVDGWSLSFFSGLSLHAVGYYLPLDGTMARDSRSVDSKPVVGSASLGAAVRHGRWVLSLSLTDSTKAFEGQDDGAEFGALSLSWF